MLAFERQSQILSLLNKNKKITNTELQQIFGVSPCTVRNDLNQLSKQNLIKRTHGGAVIINDDTKNLSFNYRRGKNSIEKDSICNCGKDFIKEGQSIILDASSTSLALCKYVNNLNRLTVITNGIYTALELKDNPRINVILTGGLVTTGSGSIEGILSNDLINNINSDIAFVSAHGFSLEHGLMDFNVYECELKKILVGRAKKIIALLDYSKLDQTSTASFAPSSTISTIITDYNAPRDLIHKYKSFGIEVIVAEKQS